MSEEIIENESSKKKIATPIQTIGTIKRVIESLYSYGKPAKRKEFTVHVGMDHSEVGKTLTDAKSLSLVTDGEKRGEYILTKKGRDFAILLGHGKEIESQRLLSKLILDSSEWEEVISFLRTKQESPFDISDLVLHVERIHDRVWSAGRRKKAERSYRTILSFADLVSIKDGLLTSKLVRDTSEHTAHVGYEEKVVSQKPAIRVRTLEAVLNKPRKTDYAEFFIPNSFVVNVSMTKAAVDHLRQQLSEDSMLHSWLDGIEQVIVNNDDE